jgi:hypothetical protein
VWRFLTEFVWCLISLKVTSCEISAFRRDVLEVFDFLGFLAALVGCPAQPLKMGTMCYPEMSVTNYQPTPRNVREERSFQLYLLPNTG